MSNFSNGVTIGDDTIKHVMCPVLSIWGEKDMTVLEYMIDETVEAIQDIRKVVIKNAGHSIMTDEPELFLKEVKEFLKE